MNTRMARAVEVASLVLVMVAGIGAWELYKAAARPVQAQPPVGDHLKCYNIGSGGEVGVLVRLADQFGVEEVNGEGQQAPVRARHEGGAGAGKLTAPAGLRSRRIPGDEPNDVPNLTRVGGRRES